MTTATERLQTRWKQADQTATGFTLVELLVASFIAGLLSLITANVMIENTKSNARAETRRRIHDDWNRATALIQSEIAMSHSIESRGLALETVSDDCPLLQDPETRLQLRMHLVGTMPDILYGVRSIASLPPSQANQWMGGANGGVLVRCGPRLTISDDGSGDYIQGTPYQQSIVLDNLDLSSGDGLIITQTPDNQKRVEFELAMQNNLGNQDPERSRTQMLSSGGMSRINEVPPIPSNQSTCSTICRSEDSNCGHGVTTLLLGDPRFYFTPDQTEPVFGTSTICTNRSVKLGDGMEGANGNYVMDGQPTPDRTITTGISLFGGAGRNILLGTSASDTLEGGPDHDGLIGRGGNDTLRGEAGNDSLVPSWDSTSGTGSSVSVDGGQGFDRVYLQEPESAYNLNGCSSRSCIIRSGNGGTLHLSNVEMLVFQTSTRRLPD